MDEKYEWTRLDFIATDENTQYMDYNKLSSSNVNAVIDDIKIEQAQFQAPIKPLIP